MGKSSRKWNKIFLLGIFGLVFTFGMPVSSVFADEIPDYMDGEIIGYNYTDWDTFYRRCNQYAPQFRYYTIGISDVYGGGSGVNRLSRFGTNRFTFVNRGGAMVTMHFLNQSKKERIQVLRDINRRYGSGDDDGVSIIEAEREFMDYNEALRFWRNAVELLQ
jgi:hypothetical protein